MINLRSEKEVDSAIGVPKRRIESNQSQEDTQVEESQSSTFQKANQYSFTTASAEIYDPTPGGEEAIAPTTIELSRAKEKQSAQPAVE